MPLPTTTEIIPEIERRELLVTGLLGLAFTAAAVAVFFGPGILNGSELFFTNDIGGSDFWHLNYPFRNIYATQLAEGRLPIWTTTVGTGFPLLAEGQISALYLPNLVLYSTLPFALALNWEILLHLVLAGAFTAAFARQRGAGRAGAVTGGLVFALSGFLLVHLKHTNMITAAAWLPLLLLLLERYANRRRPVTLVILAITVGAMGIGGHPQLVYNNLLVAGLYGLALLPGVYRRRRRAADLFRAGGGWLAAVVIGLLLAAPQFLPTWELKGLGTRQSGLSMEQATGFPYAPRHLLLFLAPNALGNPADLATVPVLDAETGEPIIDPGTGTPMTRPKQFDHGRARMGLYWENTAYVGLLPLALAVLAFVLAKNRRRFLPLLLLVVIGLILSLGEHGGLYAVFRGVVPGFDLFRFPSRFLLYVDLGIAVLAGIGLTAVLARVDRATPRAVFAGAVLGICFLDLWLTFGDHNRRVDAARWLSPPPSARRILAEEQSSDEPFRVLTIDQDRVFFADAYHRAGGWTGDLTPYEAAWNLIHPSLGALYGLNDPLVHSPSIIFWEIEATALLFGQDPRGGCFTGVNLRVASLLNVRYFIDPTRTLMGRVPVIDDCGGGRFKGPDPSAPVREFRVMLHGNPSALPRAFLVPRARSIREGLSGNPRLTHVMVALLSRSFDPTLEVLLAGAPEASAHGGGDAPLVSSRPVTILEHSSRRVRLRVDAPRECWLFLGDLYYPGWRATVSGADVPVYRANGFGRAVAIPAGRHEVEFEYRCAPLTRGLWLALGAFLALVGTLLVPRLRRGGVQAPTDSSAATSASESSSVT